MFQSVTLLLSSNLPYDFLPASLRNLSYIEVGGDFARYNFDILFYVGDFDQVSIVVEPLDKKKTKKQHSFKIYKEDIDRI